MLYGSIDEFLDNNLVFIVEYQTGNKIASNEKPSIAKLHFIKWLEDRNITLENITHVYDYIDQNLTTWNLWNINKEYLDTMENIRVKMRKETYRFVELIEISTRKDRKRVSKYILKILKNYQLSESDKSYIYQMEKSHIME